METDRKEFESILTAQNEKLTRYETRLKDVVAAYKGLLKEKEALEASLAAFTKTAKESRNEKNEQDNSTSSTSTDGNDSNFNNMQLKISTLMNSLATLSAEKSRMEASFQADKKQLRSEIKEKSNTIEKLNEKIVQIQKQNVTEMENLKSKLIVERHEREKESSNHMVMIKELQKLYADERHIKENLQMQLTDLKNKLSVSAISEKKAKETLPNEEEEHEKKSEQIKNQKINSQKSQDAQEESDSMIMFSQLQNEMHNLRQQHAIALEKEQKRAFMAEERNKKLAALHEDRVANLESRLAELSTVVGNYDRIRQQDQENIQKLKEKIAQLASGNDVVKETEFTSENRMPKNLETVVEEIIELKKYLLAENAKSNNPIDLNKIFCIMTDHTHCVEDFNKMQNEYDTIKSENQNLKQSIDIQKNHIKTLQEKVGVLNRNIEEQELEIKARSEQLSQAVKAEKSKWKGYIDNLENEYRCKLNDLELQLQKQRVRSLQLLDEKENEIKTLNTSFEIFSKTSQTNSLLSSSQIGGEINKEKSATVSHINTDGSVTTTCEHHSPTLHYVNELARKDVEISTLRKAKNKIETTLRQTLQDKIAIQEELTDKVLRLEQQIDRLERNKTRESANLEYLKNVVISFLLTNDTDGKRHMVNAIGAVLQFTPDEMKTINNIFSKKHF